MHVDEAQQPGALQLAEVGHQLLDGVHCWVESVIWVVVDAVQVIATYACSVVAGHHAVRVRHRDDLDDESLSDLLSLLAVTQQEIDYPLHHVGGIGLPRVHACSENEVVLARLCLIVIDARGDGEHGHVQTAQRFAEA